MAAALVDLNLQAIAVGWGDHRGGERPAVAAVPAIRLGAASQLIRSLAADPAPAAPSSGTPDLPGCISGFTTIEASIADAPDAFAAWAIVGQEAEDVVPIPKNYSGRFVQCVPKTLHSRPPGELGEMESA